MRQDMQATRIVCTVRHASRHTTACLAASIAAGAIQEDQDPMKAKDPKGVVIRWDDETCGSKQAFPLEARPEGTWIR